MYKEKHILNHHTAGHKLSRYLDVYELNTVNCSADKTTGYKGTEVTLIDDAAWNEKFSAWALTGATATGNNIVLNNDVTAQGIYETAKNVTLHATDGGSIAANRVSGFIGDSVTLSNTPNSGYEFSAYTLTGANLTGSTFNLTGSDVTAKAWFYLPPVNANVTYSIGNKFARDYFPNYTAFNEPDDVMNGLIVFGASGSNFGTDRYFAVKYDTRVATHTDNSLISILDTQITLNDGVYILLHDTVEAAYKHVLNPCVNYHLPYGSPFLPYTAEYERDKPYWKQNWILNGELFDSTQITAGQYEYSTTAIRANVNQNALWFDGTVQPPFDGWTVSANYYPYNENARWTSRDLCTHKFVFDKQSKSYSAFINSVARAKFTLDNPYVSQLTAIDSIRIQNAQNTDGAMFNLELASFSSLAEACRW